MTAVAGFVPCAESGTKNFLARVPLFFQVGANQQEAGEFALRASGGLQSNYVHARDFEEALLQEAQDFQAALRELLRLQRVLGGDAVEPCDEFIHARVVFHGAGAQRIHAQVDGVVPRGKTREMTENLDFADFRETLDAFATMARAQRFRWIRGRHIQRREFERAFSGRGLLEDQAFILACVARRFFNLFVHLVPVIPCESCFRTPSESALSFADPLARAVSLARAGTTVLLTAPVAPRHGGRPLPVFRCRLAWLSL